MPPLLELTGQVFGRLTVKGRAPDSGASNRVRWICECQCGTLKDVSRASLVSGGVRSCGCLKRETLGKDHHSFNGYGIISGAVRSIMISSAKKRGHEWSVSDEYLDELFYKQQGLCALTGVPLDAEYNHGKRYKTASLDRIDNSMGYLPGNVQWVLKEINIMKNKYSQDHFIQLCRLVTEHEVRERSAGQQKED